MKPSVYNYYCDFWSICLSTVLLNVTNNVDNTIIDIKVGRSFKCLRILGESAGKITNLRVGTG